MRLLVLLLTFMPIVAFARLGETESQCNTRYGGPNTDRATVASEKSHPILAGAQCRTYDYEGWRIKVAFLEFNGPSVRMTFQKRTGTTRIEDYEAEAILKANTPEGQTWKAVIYENPKSPNKGLSRLLEGTLSGAIGAAAWKRSDGALARREVTKSTMILELPIALEHEEKLKKQKEAETRASVPQF